MCVCVCQVKLACADKNPSVRQQVLQWVARVVAGPHQAQAIKKHLHSIGRYHTHTH